MRVVCQHKAADASSAHWTLHLHDYQDVFSLAQPSKTCIRAQNSMQNSHSTPLHLKNVESGIKIAAACSRL
jgi:hypothetical protein